MLDPKLLRENPEMVKENLRKRRDPDVVKLVDDFLEVDAEWRKTNTRIQELRHKRNQAAQEIPKLKGAEKQAIIKEMKSLVKDLEELEEKLEVLAEKRQWILDRIPNLVHESVPYGESDEDNVEIRRWGELPNFDFEPKDHMTLMKMHDLVDLERAAKASGSRFYYLKNEAAVLDLALAMYALDFLRREGFTTFITPSLVRKRVLYGTGFLPLGEEDIYKIEGEDLALIGTSEVALGGYHMDEVLLVDDLPKWYAAFSPCYRTEASATTGADKGIFRVHEFRKIEMFKYCLPEKSWEEHEHLIQVAEKITQSLGIPYRVVNVCTGDLGGVAAKKYDIEAWMPGQNRFREIVSCSNVTDYQARRLKVRYRLKEGSPVAGHVHTLNSTALADVRMLIAIIENYQQADGSIIIPEVLRPYTGFSQIPANR